MLRPPGKIYRGLCNSIQFSICNRLKKPFLKSLSIPDETLSKLGVRGTPEYQRVTSKGSRTMGFEWPDKRDMTEFGSMARGGGIFFAWSGSPGKQCC